MTRVYVKVALDFDKSYDEVTNEDIETSFGKVSMWEVKRSFADADEDDIQEF